MTKTKYIVFTADVQAMQSVKLRQAITDCANQKYNEAGNAHFCSKKFARKCIITAPE